MKKSSFLFLVVLILLQLIGCNSDPGGDGEGAVKGTSSAITVSGHGGLASINGTYGGGCVSRSGAWSMDLSGGSVAMPHAPLTVLKANIGCSLTITDIADAGGDYLPPSAFQLITSWAPVGYAFSNAPPVPNFYANVIADDLSYNADFHVTVLYSDDATDTTSDVASNKTVIVGTATAQLVPAPQYYIMLGSLSVQTDFADDVSSESTGAATLGNGIVVAETYVVVDGPLAATWGAIDAAYLSGTPAPNTGTFGATELVPVGTHLPATRVLILAHTEQGVSSYETFTITFNP